MFQKCTGKKNEIIGKNFETKIKLSNLIIILVYKSQEILVKH
jgi:hypothetical protein